MRQRHTAEALATRLGRIGAELDCHRLGMADARTTLSRINTILAPSDASASRNHAQPFEGGLCVTGDRL